MDLEATMACGVKISLSIDISLNMEETACLQTKEWILF